MNEYEFRTAGMKNIFRMKLKIKPQMLPVLNSTKNPPSPIWFVIMLTRSHLFSYFRPFAMQYTTVCSL